MTNQEAAGVIFSIASLLESLGANPYRIRAYRRAAMGMLRLPEPARAFTNHRGELELPWLGPRLRRKLGELVTQGRMQFHDEVMAELPADVRELLAVPGIGPKTAERLVRELDVHSIHELATAASEGRLQTMRGIGRVREQRLASAAEALLTAAA